LRKRKRKRKEEENIYIARFCQQGVEAEALKMITKDGSAKDA